MPKRMLQGTVLSTKGDKTIVISVESRLLHPVMKKVVRRTKNYMAHDANNKAMVGALVWIRECRPISKSKTWELISEQEAMTMRGQTMEQKNHKSAKKKIKNKPQDF